MPSTTRGSNYTNIEQALKLLLQQQFPGIEVEVGDFSKIRYSSPIAVLQHARLKQAQTDRKPSYTDYNWMFPLYFVFDYQNDKEAHDLVAQYRLGIIRALEENPLLSIAVPGASYPPMQAGHAKDSMLWSAGLVGYFTLDEKAYALSLYEIWVQERVAVTRSV